MRSFETAGVHIDGKFGELTKDDVAILVIAHGGTPTSAGKSSILLAGEGSKKRDDFVAAGKEVLSLADLGAPGAGWLDRLTRQVDALRTGKRKKEFRNFAFGAPSAASLVERVEERIGFEAPAELRHLLVAFNGLTLVSVRSSKPIAVEADTLLPPLELLNATGPLWSAVGKQTASTINILPWEEYSSPIRCATR
jgi:hypothetical protein